MKNEEEEEKGKEGEGRGGEGKKYIDSCFSLFFLNWGEVHMTLHELL